MKYLTTDEHRTVVERLVTIPRDLSRVRTHSAGIPYTSLMMCFLMHSKGAAESLLALHRQLGKEWFPATTGYVIVRSLFEVDVNAHYISADPSARSLRYIDFGHVIRKSGLEAVERHRASPKASWREGMQLVYSMQYASQKHQIELDYNRVRSVFESANGKRASSWSGKSVYSMAKEVDHLEAYDIFYADLSAFTHANVKLADRFLRVDGLSSGGPAWSQRCLEADVAHVFRYGAIFLSCFLELFGKQFGTWDSQRVSTCWEFPEATSERRGQRP